MTTPSERVQRLREETAKAGWNGYCERNRTGAKVLVLLALTLDGRHSEMVHAQSGERLGWCDCGQDWPCAERVAALAVLDALDPPGGD